MLPSSERDDDIIKQIDALVEEERELHSRSATAKPLSHREIKRLNEIEVRLDQCWDLLRQRRAKRDAFQDPQTAAIRPPEVVEQYRQ